MKNTDDAGVRTEFLDVDAETLTRESLEEAIAEVIEGGAE